MAAILVSIDEDDNENEGIHMSSFRHINEDEEEPPSSDEDSLIEDKASPAAVVVEEDKPPNLQYFLIVAWVTFLGEMSRGVVVPVLWPYLQLLNGTLAFLGFVSSGFSFARFFAAPFFGWMSGVRGHKEVMQICLVLLVVGNIMFALYPPPWVLLVSRIIIGLGAGTLGQSRGYVSQVTSKSQRTRYMAYLTVSQFAGFAVTPGITSLLSFIDFDLFGVDRLEADAYSSAGYLMATLSFVTIFIVGFAFAEPPKQEVKTTEVPEKTSGGVRAYIKSAIKLIPQFIAHPEFKKILLFATLIFATRTAVAVVETSSSQLITSFSWTTQTLSYCLCGMGVLGTIILISLPEVCKKIGKEYGEGMLLCLGVFSLGLGLALMIGNSVYAFIAGLFFTWAIGSSLCQTLIISFLSRVLNPNSQGAVMGWLASLGSISRIIGSLWVGATLEKGAWLALGGPAIIMIPCLLGTSFLVVRMIRTSYNTKL